MKFSRLPIVYIFLFAGFYMAFGSSPASFYTPPATPIPFTGTFVFTTTNQIYSLAPNDHLPSDSVVRSGQLANGLHYFVQHNDQPVQRAELRLVVGAGSWMEEDDQRGLAHFVEHMLFNGTRRFPHHQLDQFLRDTGMELGADLNAYTSFEETIYYLRIPTDEPVTVERALDVLEDWVASASFDEEEVKRERGVIVEEWRLREENVDGRIARQQWPLLMGNTRYATRLPIGEMAVIRNASAEQVRDFYQTWYRPERMAVIAVGDFDLNEMEQAIKIRFAPLRATPAQERASVKLPNRQLPSFTTTQYQVITDTELATAQVELYTYLPGESYQTLADFRKGMITDLWMHTLRDRFAKMSGTDQADFLSTQATNHQMLRPFDSIYLQAQLRTTDLSGGLTTFFNELQRMHQQGVTANELDLAKKKLMRSYQGLFNQRNDLDHGSLADQYQDVYLHQMAAIPAELQLVMVKTLLLTITVADLNTRAQQLMEPSHQVVLLQAPAQAPTQAPTQDAEMVPSLAQIASLYADAIAQEQEPYEEYVTSDVLLDATPEAVAVTARQPYPDLGISEITLANGIRIWMKPTPYQQDEILFTSSSPGGLSLLDDVDYLEGVVASDVLQDAGVNQLDGAQLADVLAGQHVWVSPYIHQYYEGIEGEAAPENLETMFQLIYLYATQPFFFDEAFELMESDWETMLKEAENDPHYQVERTALNLLYPNNLRHRLPSVSDIRQIDRTQLQSIYRARFADMSDFTFVFVGAFDPDELTTLAQHYLGALPAGPGGERWQVREKPPTQTAVMERTLYEGQDEKSIVQLRWTGRMEDDTRHLASLYGLQALLTMQLNDELREKRSGVYDVSVDLSTHLAPESFYDLQINFTCDPQRTPELIEATLAVIQSLGNSPIPPDTIKQLREQDRRANEEAHEDNHWWRDQIDYYTSTPGLTLANFNDYTLAYSQLDGADLQSTIQHDLPLDRYIQVVLYPEGYAQK